MYKPKGKTRLPIVENPAYLEIIYHLAIEPNNTFGLSKKLKKSHSIIYRQLQTLEKEKYVIPYPDKKNGYQININQITKELFDLIQEHIKETKSQIKNELSGYIPNGKQLISQINKFKTDKHRLQNSEAIKNFLENGLRNYAHIVLNCYEKEFYNRDIFYREAINIILFYFDDIIKVWHLKGQEVKEFELFRFYAGLTIKPLVAAAFLTEFHFPKK